MATVVEKTDRNVIPRWRDFVTTISLGELNGGVGSRQATTLNYDLTTLERDWVEQGTLSFAGDLISAASLAGNSRVAVQAAEFVLQTQGESLPDHPLTLIAKKVLAAGHEFPIHSVASPPSQTSPVPEAIAKHRKQLRASPRNGIMWVDLALLYAQQGVADKARKAMTVALDLEPTNRFVLRSASRLFIHLNEPDRAHNLLRRSAAIRNDPWLIAAEISTATATKRVSFAIDDGIRLLASNKFNAADTTELAAAIATLQVRDGSTGKAKKFIRQGLINPNENSLAQAKWLSDNVKGLRIREDVVDFNVARSFEASMWEALMKQQWTSAAASSIGWLRDQPFSSRPAILSAHIAAGLLEDYDAAERLVKLGLTANPHDVKLRLLLAFIYGSTDRKSEALGQLHLIKGPVSQRDEVTRLANFGLVAFRDNQQDAGRLFYSAAVERAEAIAEDPYIATALTYWAREEVRAKTAHAPAILTRAGEAVKRLGTESYEAIFTLRRVEEAHLVNRERTL